MCWLERNVPGPLAWIADDLIPLGWALIKLSAAVFFIVTTWPALVAEAFICNLVTRHYGHEIGTVAEAILRRDERDRSHVYKAVWKAEQTQRQLINDLLDRAFGGSAKQLVLQALATNKASAKEMAEIRRLLDKFEGGE